MAFVFMILYQFCPSLPLDDIGMDSVNDVYSALIQHTIHPIASLFELWHKSFPYPQNTINHSRQAKDRSRSLRYNLQTCIVFQPENIVPCVID